MLGSAEEDDGKYQGSLFSDLKGLEPCVWRMSS